jgi:hypothetical protein
VYTVESNKNTDSIKTLTCDGKIHGMRNKKIPKNQI